MSDETLSYENVAARADRRRSGVFTLLRDHPQEFFLVMALTAGGTAAFYAYTAPEPAGLAEEPLEPEAAWWDRRDGSHLAVLRYDDARTADDPRATVLDFYESAYQAGARLAGWDIQRLACPGGITDPHLRRQEA